MNDLLTPRELASELKISLAMIRKLTKSLPHFRIGKLVRFHKNEVLQHFEKENNKNEKRAA